MKDAVYARLRLMQPGPGAIHSPHRLDADDFRQLTAERVVTRFPRGRPIRSWRPKRDGEGNEALDTFVWLYLRERFLSLRLLHSTDAIIAACCDAWMRLVSETDRIKSLCSYPWIEKAAS